MSDIVERLKSSEPLPYCPYDSRSPEYWTAPNDKPCKVCGGLNDPNAPDLCRGADTRLFKEAADEIERLREQNDRYRKALEVINGSADWLVARQAASALDNIGPSSS